MKLLIIGQAVVDKIEFVGGGILFKPGGVHHACAGISMVSSETDKLYLCTSFDEDTKELFENTFSIFNQKYVNKVEKIPRVHLKIFPDKERDEKYDNINQTLITDFIDLNSFDGILLNMITGFDVSIEQAETIRKNFRGLIYFDVHTLSRGLDENLNRKFRLIPEFERWAKSADIIQMNESEMVTVSRCSSEIKIAEELIASGLKIIIITKGKTGVRIYYKNKEEIFSLFISALKVTAVNTVGCGDVFGAVFFYNYIETKNINLALHKAVRAAALAASGLNPQEIKKLL